MYGRARCGAKKDVWEKLWTIMFDQYTEYHTFTRNEEIHKVTFEKKSGAGYRAMHRYLKKQ